MTVTQTGPKSTTVPNHQASPDAQEEPQGRQHDKVSPRYAVNRPSNSLAQIGANVTALYP